MIKFYTAKNYKNGKYIMSRYKHNDFYIICAFIVVGVILLFVEFFSENPSLMTMAEIMIVGLLPLALFTPVNKYFNVLTWIQSMLAFQTRNKNYLWGGVDYEIEDQDKSAE